MASASCAPAHGFILFVIVAKRIFSVYDDGGDTTCFSAEVNRSALNKVDRLEDIDVAVHSEDSSAEI
jgi:hypothetical protein